MNILDKLAAHAKERCDKAKEYIFLEELKKLAAATPKGSFEFEKALRKPGISFICECKKASPSKGLIAPDFPYLKIAKEYERAGADCISVLTEPKWLIDVPYIQRLTSNPQSLIEPLAKQAISSLCSASTFNNVVCYSYSSNAYQPADYTNDLVRLLFSTPSPNRWRRYVQSQAVSVLISAWNSGTTVESRSYVTEALQLIQQRVRQAGGDPATRAHYKQLDLLIKLTFEK